MIIGNSSTKYAHPQLANFLNNLLLGSRNMSILIVGDSTSNDPNELGRQYGLWLAAKYPTYTVRYRLFDNVTTFNYAASSSLNAGTTAGLYIDIWNFSIGGSVPQLILGNLTKGAMDIINNNIYTDVSNIVDLIIYNHGHNLLSIDSYYNTMNRLSESIETVTMLHPDAGVIVVKQNPNRDDNLSYTMIKAVEEYARKRGYAVANVWDKFIAFGKASSLYFDNIHPSGVGNVPYPSGQDLMLQAVTDLMLGKIGASSLTDSIFKTSTNNLLTNGNFTTWTTPDSTPPDGFTVSGGTCSKDTTEFDDPSKAYSCKVVATGGAACYIDILFSNKLLAYTKGKTFTIAVRVKINTGVTSGAPARVGFWTGLNNTPSSMMGQSYLGQKGVWTWIFATCNILSNDAYARARIYMEAGTANAGQYINIDRIVMVKGTLAGDSI